MDRKVCPLFKAVTTVDKRDYFESTHYKPNKTMQNSLNNTALFRVYFNSLAQHFVLIHENLWNFFDAMPSDQTWFMEKVYAGTESECEDFIRMQHHE